MELWRVKKLSQMVNGYDEEAKLLRRFAPIRARQIRSVFGTTGLLYREILVDPTLGSTDPATWITMEEAEDRLRISDMHEEHARLCRRAVTRLGREITTADLEYLPVEELRILRLSQTEYKSTPNGQRIVAAASGVQKTGNRAGRSS